MTSQTSTTRSLPTSTHGSNIQKIKTKIIKTYHHDICMTYDGLISRSDLSLDDSDPDETQHIMSTMILNGGGGGERRCSQTDSCGRSSDNRAIRTQYSIGGISAVDSGVVSHDSLLDRYREMSVTRGSDERSESPSYSTMATQRSSSQGRSLGRRGEFDPLNRTVLLDSRLRSRSKGRVEEEQRGRSPCRSHGVKQMINYFEGSQETLTSTPTDPRATTDLHREEQQHPVIKPALHKTSPGSPRLRLARSRNSSTKNISGSPTAAPPPDNEDTTPSTPLSRTKQENALHLTCVASGYTQYSPYSERKAYQNGGSVTDPPPPSAETDSNYKLNGATTITADTDNGITTATLTQTSPQSINGDAGVTSLTQDVTTDMNKHASSTPASDSALAISSDQVILDVVENGRTTPEPSDGKTSDKHIDEVDRSLIFTNGGIGNNNQPGEVLPINGVCKLSSVEDSPSKKNGDWFLKVTDNAQVKLLSLCEIAQRDLENDLTEEVSGQIRAAIGKANLLVYKKFKQFRGLCEKNLTQGPDEPFPTTSQDLAGFWDMVSIQVENCETSFSEIDTLRANGWVQQVQNDITDAPRKPTTPRGQKSFDTSLKSETNAKTKSANKMNGASKARDEARKRLMAAKKAMRQRRNSESDDVIFVPSN